ncbi:MBL fold metallo-hydrolase [Herbiconiux daphne]|uniref:MBL fold metallo-hydrolase n=1 Tax=Herbiconiux daphne TaxID=2970914 RepID=A0ABT2H5W2_9MICO|nr:MBL fold metallo-hydrolase [Herbiconiux daphne]MCS5735335.1 MBL fold metallo-hydrolase [Herbiconiux daphne]
MRLTVLGTATPYPRPGNACSGYLLTSSVAPETETAPENETAPETDAAAKARPTAQTTVWLDAGTGTLAELQRHTEIAELDAIWVSHRHADHSADLLVAYYALRFAERAPAAPIPLIAPEGMLERLAAFLGPNSVAELPRVFEHRPMSGFGDAEFGDLRLEWGPVQHGVPAFGLTVLQAGRRFAYSGDSAPCLSLDEIADDADTLLLEAGYDHPAAGGEAPAHHTPEDAGRTAAAAGVKRLVLTHIAGTVTADEVVARAAAHFAGEIVVARPGDHFTI